MRRLAGFVLLAFVMAGCSADDGEVSAGSGPPPTTGVAPTSVDEVTATTVPADDPWAFAALEARGRGGTRRTTTGGVHYPGQVVVIPAVVGSHMPSWTGFGYQHSPWVRQNGPIVSRSPLNQEGQVVCVTYGLTLLHNGLWHRELSATACSFLLAGQAQVQLPGFDSGSLNRGNWFAMVHEYWWIQDGQLIGYQKEVLDSPSQYGCNTTLDTCYVGDNYLCLRAPYTGLCRTT